MPNEEQVALWDGALGARWAADPDLYDSLNRAFGEHILEVVAAGSGERVLDVGCGNGALALALAPRVAPGGSVLGLDVSSAMLDRARQKAQQAGASNAIFEKGDAQVHPLPEASFDFVVSRFGIMFFDDARTAFTNVARATRPGGRLVFTCWQDITLQERKSVPALAALPHLPGASMPDSGSAFSLADVDHTTALLHDAGFESVEITSCVQPQTLPMSVADAAVFLREAEVESMFEGADPAPAAAATRAIAGALEAHVSAEGIGLLGSAWLVSATRAS